MTKRILYLVTEDWYFLSHRLPMARAAKAAGLEVHVAARMGTEQHAIETEGFIAHPLDWRRGSLNPFGNLGSVLQLRRLLSGVRPHILHNIAMKPVLLGSFAASGLQRIAIVNSLAGLGSIYLARSATGKLMKAGFVAALGRLIDRAGRRTIVQNPDDEAALLQLGVAPSRISLIPGSGVDTSALTPLPEPSGPVTAAFVGRMLEDKGLRALMAAHGLLRARDIRLRLLLAGTPDPENPTSITLAELQGWAREPGVTWLGQVPDIRKVWQQAHFAVLPSRREGLPKSLLEAAACGRAMVATDAPGCREIARHQQTGLLVPIDDAGALAQAMQRLTADADLRRRLGAAARTLAVGRFSAEAIGRQTVALYQDLLAEVEAGGS